MRGERLRGSPYSYYPDGAFLLLLQAQAGHRMYACGQEYVARVNMTQTRHEKQALPCIFEEVTLYFLQEVYAWWVAAIMEIKKRRDVQMVNTLVAVFVPVRHSACSVFPLVDAALYLMSASTPVSQHRWR
jgi:hypothetical protein